MSDPATTRPPHQDVPPTSEPATSTEPHPMQGINEYWRQLDATAISEGAHRELVGGLWDSIGQLQLDHLRAEGLAPHHALLDVGCGALRGGVHFVRYLEPGQYCGLDINRSLLEAGRRELALAGLEGRGVQLLEDREFAADRFGRRFDFALAQSLFTHLPMNLIIACLVRVGAVLAPEGRFYATFFRAPRPACLDTVVQQPGGAHTQFQRDLFHYAAEEMVWMGRAAGLDCEVAGDWGHPRAQEMAIYRHPQG